MTELKKLFTLCLILVGSVQMSAQCDTIASICQQNIGSEFISDGQAYRAFLTGEEVAEFRTTLFGDSKYRIASCSGTEKGAITFRVLDAKRNELFTNEDYDRVSAWNFQVENTIDCIIEAQLNPEVSDSGCGVVLISFER
jgi:hypothetical protein